MPALRIDVNCDLGEGVGGASHDASIMPHVTSTSVACGGHAGDRATMTATVSAAIAAGVAVGAHPSYPDMPNFGRVSMAMDAAALTASVADQLRALTEVAAELGTAVRFVKAHGALYNDAARDAAIAEALLDGIALAGTGQGSASLPILTLPRSELGRLARERGIRVFSEAFPDRGYRADGTLVPRPEAHALVHDPARVAERALRIAQHGVIDAEDGSDLAVEVESICIHGDAPGAEDAASAIAALFAEHGVEMRAFV